jgi:hypothetical protein
MPFIFYWSQDTLHHFNSFIILCKFYNLTSIVGDPCSFMELYTKHEKVLAKLDPNDLNIEIKIK